jgi:hypothetical protein
VGTSLWIQEKIVTRGELLMRKKDVALAGASLERTKLFNAVTATVLVERTANINPACPSVEVNLLAYARQPPIALDCQRSVRSLVP